MTVIITCTHWETMHLLGSLYTQPQVGILAKFKFT